jgi:hypothetical protein
MTKARTEGGKRKSRRGRRPGDDGQPNNPGGRPRKDGPREPNGRAQRGASPRENPRLLAAIARARQAAADPPTSAEAVTALCQPWMSCNVGRAIADAPDAAQLWATLSAIRNANASYLAAIDAPRIAGSRMGDAPPPDHEANPPRVLTPDEADMEAVAAWRATLRAMDATGHGPELRRAALHDEPCNGIAAMLSGFGRSPENV